MAVNQELQDLKDKYKTGIEFYKTRLKDSENYYIEENSKLNNQLNAAMNMLKAIPPGRTEHDAEKVKELGEKLETANRELEDRTEKYRTDIERYHSTLESFTKSCTPKDSPSHNW